MDFPTQVPLGNPELSAGLDYEGSPALFYFDSPRMINFNAETEQVRQNSMDLLQTPRFEQQENCGTPYTDASYSDFWSYGSEEEAFPGYSGVSAFGQSALPFSSQSTNSSLGPPGQSIYGSFKHEQPSTLGCLEHRTLSTSATAYSKLTEGQSGPQLVLKRPDRILCQYRMPVIQTDKERCTGPAYEHSGPRPSADCEVFGGQLPKVVYEDRIYPIFSRYGKIYEIRILINPKGYNLGYFYVLYYNEKAARLAARELNGFKFSGVSSGDGIRLNQTVQLKRLYVSRIPNIIPNGRCSLHFRELLYGTNCEIGLTDLFAPYQEGSQIVNQGFCILEYQTHLDALAAWKWIDYLRPFGANAIVNWSVPRGPKPEDPQEVGKYEYIYCGTNNGIQTDPSLRYSFFPQNY